MSFIVKNTTKISVLDWLCPHYCRGCGRLGPVLCDCCKKNNNYVKNKITVDFDKKKLDKMWVCGWRDETLGKLVEEYKYQSLLAARKALVEALAQRLPKMRGRVIVVPLPTISRHVRERGLDHTWRLARSLARVRGWRAERLLVRNKNTVQVGATMRERKQQAEKAYIVNSEVRGDVTYLLLDDVWTTGASMQAAAQILRDAGAKKVMGVVVVASRMQDELSSGFSNADGVQNKVDNSKGEN